MKKTFLKLSLLFVLLGACSLSFAQQALTGTTLSAAINATTNSVTLASTSGVVVGTVLFIEDGTAGARSAGEAVFVVALPVSGTTVQVVRGYDQTIPNPHIANVPIVIGPSPASGNNSLAFVEVEPSGGCTPANTFAPTINLKTGNQWLCSSITNSWVPGFFNIEAPAGVSAAVASAATATPSGPLFHVTGAVAITTIGSGVGMGGSGTSTVGAPFCIIPDNATASGLTAGNNIAKSTTFVVNQPVCLVFDQTNKKYVASY